MIKIEINGIATSVRLAYFFSNGILAVGKSICPYLHSDGMEVVEPTKTCTSETSSVWLVFPIFHHELLEEKHLLGVAIAIYCFLNILIIPSVTEIKNLIFEWFFYRNQPRQLVSTLEFEAVLGAVVLLEGAHENVKDVRVTQVTPVPTRSTHK